MLAHVTFLRSYSKADPPAEQDRALRFVEEARGIIDYSIVAGSKDPSLVQAAIILAVFEYQPHKTHDGKRSENALKYLDACGRLCWDTQLDKVIIAGRHKPADLQPDRTVMLKELPLTPTSPIAPEVENSAELQTLVTDLQHLEVSPHVNQWASTPPWGPEWTVAQTQREEMRRMIWIGSSMAAAVNLWRVMRKFTPLALDLAKTSSVSEIRGLWSVNER